MQNFESTQSGDFPQSPIKKESFETALIATSPNNPPWSNATAVLVWILSVVFIMVVPAIGVAVYLLSKGPLTKNVLEALQNDSQAILVNIFCVIPAHILTVVVAWMVVTNVKKFPFRETVGWQWGGFRAWHVVALLIVFFGLAIGLTKAFGESENELMRVLKSSREAVYAVAFMATITAPLVEEVVYRGILYSAFQRSIGVWPAVLLVTSLFALVHVPQYYPSWATILVICFLSLSLTLIRAFTNNLLPCVVLHTIVNGIQSIFLVAEPWLPKDIQ